MAHSSEARWGVVAADIAKRCGDMVRALEQSESLYQDLLEVYQYAGGTDQGLADLLFKPEIAARGDAQANSDEVAKVADLRLATVALHELYEAADNVAVSQDDRFSALRRMS